MQRDFHLPGRSAVIAGEGMAATSHPLAAIAAIDTLRAGGSAADAAVTAVALLSVLEPHMTGVGGDCFCLVAKPGERVWGYNGSGRAGAAAKPEMLLEQGIRAIGPDSIHAVTVPGAVEAWAAILRAHGRFGLDRALAAGDPLRAGRSAGRAARRLRLEPGDATAARRSGRQPALPARRTRACRRRQGAVSGACRQPQIDCRAGAARLLSRSDRRGHCGDDCGARQLHQCVRFFRPSRRAGGAARIAAIAASTSSSCRRTGRGSLRSFC